MKLRTLALPAATLAVAAAGLTLGVALPTPTPSPSPTPSVTCMEDEPCWDARDCAENGNRTCSSDLYAADAWASWDKNEGTRKLKVDCSGAFRVDYMAATTTYPENLDGLDLVLPGTTPETAQMWYVFRAACS